MNGDNIPSPYTVGKDGRVENVNGVNVSLSMKEVAQLGADSKFIYDSATLRESPWPQFDMLGYSVWNETNEMADMSFIPPKVNKLDTRMVTGTTHEKVTSFVSLVGNYKMRPIFHIKHKTEELYDLSIAMTTWVEASREEENYNEKRPIIDRNMIVQGTTYVLEVWREKMVKDQKVDYGSIDYTKLDDAEWEENGNVRYICGPESVFVDPKKVFLQNYRETDIRKQPRYAILDYTPLETLQAIWGDSPRWKFVPKQSANAYGLFGYGIEQPTLYSEWLFSNINENKAVTISIYDQVNQRFQFYINGYPMLPIKFPLKIVSPGGVGPLAKGDLDPMNMFFNSKGIASKMKVDQAVFDEVLKMLLLKVRKSANPAKANNTGLPLTPYMFMPGQIVDQVDPTQIANMEEKVEINQSDTFFYNAIKEIMDSKSVTSLLEGQSAPGGMTLGQYMDMQKKQMLKIGRYLDGVANRERQQALLRFYNLVAHGTRPVRSFVDAQGNTINQYKDVAMEANIGNDQKGVRMLKFVDDNNEFTRTPDMVEQEEVDYEAETGKAARFNYINPALLQAILYDPDYTVSVEIVPEEAHNDQMSRLSFIDGVKNAAALFGPESLNKPRLKKRYASVMNEQYDTYFISDEELKKQQEMAAQQAMMASMGGAPGMPPANAMPGQVPSIDKELKKKVDQLSGAQ
jgi:hypothetical protein